MCRNRWIRTFLVAVPLVLAGVLGAAAEEVVHFNNGTAMAVRGHEVHDGMIHVDLGGDAAMAFPISQIERITDSGQDVFRPEEWQPSNVATTGTEPRGKAGIRVQRRISTGAPVFARNNPRGGQAAAKRRQAPPSQNIQDLLAVAAARRAANEELPGTRRAVPDHVNGKARGLRVAGRADAYAGASLQNGRMNSLGVTVGGESKFMSPEMQRKTSNNGVEVLRFNPSEEAAMRAAAAGQPLENNRRPPPPPADGGSTGSGSDSGN